MTEARKNLRKEERREQILQAALRAFGRGGYHGTHVEHVVAEAGIARGTFYLHFASKHDVFEALVDRVLQAFLDARPDEEIAEIRTAADAEQVLRRSYRAVLETFHAHRRLARLLFDEAVGLEKGFRQKLERHYAAWHKRVKDLLDHLVGQGLARPDLDTDLVAQMVLGMVERVTRTRLFGAAKPDIPSLVETLVRFELEGIRG